MEVPSQHSKYSRTKTPDDYSLQELSAEIEALKNENFHMALKTEVFERYLRKRCPMMLIGLEMFSEKASARSTMLSSMTMRSSISTNVSERSYSLTSPSQSGHPSHSHAYSSTGAYKISPLFKIDMVARELDESKIAMDKLRKRFESAKFMLQTEEENLQSDIMFISDIKIAFENFVKQNTDKKSSRVPNDKLIRYLESEQQNNDRTLRKLKLTTKSLQIEYNRLVTRHEQRIELRERLHPVDMTKLMIENEKLQERFDEKNKLMLELKKTVGKKGQALVSMKSKLNDVLLHLKSIKQDIKQKETKYKFTEEKEVENVNELITAEIINQNMKRLNSEYKSPDAHNYLMVQVRLGELKAEKEVWERRRRYQVQSLALLEHQLKQLSPQQPKSRAVSTRSYRSSKSLFSSQSAESILRHYQGRHSLPHGTPTTPISRQW